MLFCVLFCELDDVWWTVCCSTDCMLSVDCVLFCELYAARWTVCCPAECMLFGVLEVLFRGPLPLEQYIRAD